MTPEAQHLYAVIVLVRACFHRLRTAADDLHQDLGITAPQRAVMEALAMGGGQTVPAIAREKGVTRQHIQAGMDALSRTGHVATRANRAHRRSPLYTLTDKGQATFMEILNREGGVLDRLAQGLPPETLQAAEETLAALNEQLIDMQETGGEDAQATTR